MAAFEPKRCYTCDRLFCCADCCAEHYKNKHPERGLQCPLCLFKVLTIRDFKNDNFLKHVSEHHLPLKCTTCGDLFNDANDLLDLGRCSCRLLKNKQNSYLFSADKKLVNGKTPLSNINTPSTSDIRRQSVESISNLDVENFSSPPEFSRYTSTPMHVNFLRKNSETSIIPRIPNFSLKTPQTPSLYADAQQQFTSPLTINPTQSESLFFSLSSINNSVTSEKTPLKSILVKKSDSDSIKLKKKIFAKNLKAMQEMDKTDCQQINSIEPGVIVLEKVNSSDEGATESNQSETKDCRRKVRFSVNLDDKKNCDSSNTLNVTEGDEFFEANQSLSDHSYAAAIKLPPSIPKIPPPVPKKPIRKNPPAVPNKPISKIPPPVPKKPIRKNPPPVPNKPISKTTVLSTEILNNEQKDYGIEKCKEENINSTNKMEKFDSETDLNISDIVGSSKVVMCGVIVLMENTSNENQPDLTPIINSGLKKLEKIASSSLENCYENNNSTNQSTKNSCNPSILSIDTYTSVSTLERIETPVDQEKSLSVNEKSIKKTPMKNGQSIGILGAVANAVKNVFRNPFNGQMKNDISCTKYNFSSNDSLPFASSTMQSHSFDTSTSSTTTNEKSSILLPSKSTSLLPSATTTILSPIPSVVPKKSASFASSASPFSGSKSTTLASRSSKRGREEDLITCDSTGVEKSNENPDRSNDGRSPLMKRHRGWYKKIRGRDPIDRMKTLSLNSQKGISLETQCFQQGTLSVGNLVIPIPARAHQATQTE